MATGRRAFDGKTSASLMVFDMSPDARRFLVNASILEQISQPLTLVVPWTAGIPRQ